ncbi:MAG: hypothetical protein QXP94_03110 [Thermofilaceae archaeon]
MAARRFFEPVYDVGSGDLLRAAEALVSTRGLVARVPGGVVTLDTLIAVAASEGLHRAKPEKAVADLPIIGGRVGAARALSHYVARGCKYALTQRGALTPRSVYAAIELHPAEVAARATPPAVAAPNTTLRGALIRMRERGSICAFIVRAGRLKGVVDAWTALGEAVRRGEEGLEASCSSFASTDALVGALDELAEPLAEYGFAAALVAGRPLLIDDVSLHRALVASAELWLQRVR